MLLATVISEPDLQKKVKNSVVLAKPVSVCGGGVSARVRVCACVCALADLYAHQLSGVPIGCFLGAAVVDRRGEGTVHLKWNSLTCFAVICRLLAGVFASWRATCLGGLEVV